VLDKLFTRKQRIRQDAGVTLFKLRKNVNKLIMSLIASKKKVLAVRKDDGTLLKKQVHRVKQSIVEDAPRAFNLHRGVIKIF